MSEAAVLDREAAVFDSPDDRALIRREAAADASFGRKIAQMLRAPDGEERVAVFAKQAVLNEIDPKQFPQTRGSWNLLRAATRKLMEELPPAIVASVSKMPLQDRAKALEAIQSGQAFPFKPVTLGELGQFEIVGSLINSVAGAAATAYSAYLNSSTQKQIADMQLEAQKRQLQAQMAMANAQTAMANASISQPIQSALSTLQMDMGGIPLWMLALGVYLFFKYKE